MRIAYLVSGFPLLSETFVVNQIAGMAARGCHVDIFATSGVLMSRLPEAVERHGLMAHVHRLDAPQSHLLRLFRIVSLLLVYGWRAPYVVLRSVNISRYGRAAATLGLLHAALTLIRLGAQRYDVIHAQFGTYGPLALRLVETGALRSKIVVSFRGYDATKFLVANPRAYDALFRKGSLFLPVSQALARRIIDAGCDPARVRVHHSGIDCARFPYRERTTVHGAQAPRVVMIGRLVEKKGFECGIQAVARALTSGRAMSCTIIGEGPKRRELEQLIRELGVGAHVRMVGARDHDEVIREMDQSHILIAPSITAADGDEEGIPNTVKEAMAMGLPVISTFHAGVPELVQDGVSGFLVPERDVESLANRLSHLVDHPATWAAMGRAGRRRIEAQFDIDRLNDELLVLYRGMLAMPEGRTEDNNAGSSPSGGPSHADCTGGYEYPIDNRHH